MFDNAGFAFPATVAPTGEPDSEGRDSSVRRAEIRRVRELIGSRARRTDHFNAQLFSDPAWDILLDLYLAQLLQCRMTVSSLGASANIPPTTALRWIETLLTGELIKKASDPLDRRRTFVALTEKGQSAMQGYFAGFSRSPAIF